MAEEELYWLDMAIIELRTLKKGMDDLFRFTRCHLSASKTASKATTTHSKFHDRRISWNCEARFERLFPLYASDPEVSLALLRPHIFAAGSFANSACTSNVAV
jgi:hypothetical protein